MRMRARGGAPAPGSAPGDALRKRVGVLRARTTKNEVENRMEWMEGKKSRTLERLVEDF